jgi:ATP-dependent exoDNAse (exonuclease V) alpha subunit
LNTFVDWGRAATFEASLWRKPVDYGWHPDVLECGYLLIDEASEFRLRFQAIANPAIRFLRHLLEVGME